MNIETTKLELIHLLLNTEKESILNRLKAVFNSEKNDWWDDLSQADIDSINSGLEDVKVRTVVPHKEAMKRIFGK